MESVCAFCLEPMADPGDVIELGCHHLFHRSCMLLAHGDSCPSCRHIIAQGEGGITEQDLGLMRKRKRDDVEQADQEAAEEVLSRDYIGPGTRRYRIAVEALLELCGSPARLCAMDEKRLIKKGHKCLHKGALSQCHVSCRAVQDFIVSTRLMLLQAKDDEQEQCGGDASLLDWIAIRLPTLPPSIVHDMVHAHDPSLDCGVIDSHIRMAWRTLSAIKA